MPIWSALIPELNQLTTKQLRQRYFELFGDATHAANRVWLIRRIAWRVQAQVEGGLSERAKLRALELANDCDIRLSPPTHRRTSRVQKPATPSNGLAGWDRRLPVPGTILCRVYKGKEIRVKVQAQGIEYEGMNYASLTAVAKAITGSHTNGYLFFRLGKYQGGRA
ncbi:MAG: DUF2924 domain-containing protein [Gemmatales bacterium]